MGQKNTSLKVTSRLRLQGDCGSVDCVRLTCRRTTCCCGRRRRLLAAFTFRGEDGLLDAAQVATVKVGRLMKKDGETPVRVTCLARGTAVLEKTMTLNDLLSALKRTTSGHHAALYFCLVGEKQQGARQAYTALFCNGRRVGDHDTADTTTNGSALTKSSPHSEADFQDALDHVSLLSEADFQDAVDQVSLDSEGDFKDALDQARLDFRAYFQEALDQVSLLSDSDFDYFQGQTSLPPGDEFHDALDHFSLLPEADLQGVLDQASLLPEADLQYVLDQASLLPEAGLQDVLGHVSPDHETDVQEAEEVSLNCEADVNVESPDSEDDLEEVNLDSEDDLDEESLDSEDDLRLSLDSEEDLEVSQDCEVGVDSGWLTDEDSFPCTSAPQLPGSQDRAPRLHRAAGLLGRVTVLAVLLLYYNYSKA